jgi:hypothetical protein
MIYFSESPLKAWQPNLIMLDLEDDIGHIYVTRNTYDQAVLLSDRFNHEPDLVMDKLGCPKTQEDTVSYMIAVLPLPINILVPFYNLIDSSVKLDVENIKQVIGVLSYMSMNLDFNMILKVPFEVRANLVFTKSILLDYQGHFEDFNFRITSAPGHIVREGVETERLPRSEQKDFDLEEQKEAPAFDVDSFMADLGWDDIEIPKLNTGPEPASTSVATESKTSTASSDSAPALSEAEVYDDIARKFA